MLNALRHVWFHPFDVKRLLTGTGEFVGLQIATRLLLGGAMQRVVFLWDNAILAPSVPADITDL
jgi:hypothetical protein